MSTIRSVRYGTRWLGHALLAASFVTQALAANLYGTTTEDLVDSADRYAHPRSMAEYRHIIPEALDLAAMCRNAGDIAQCVWRLNGKQYPPSPGLVAKVRSLEKK